MGAGYDDARPEAESDEGAGLLHTGSFQLKRSGAGPVDGSQKFGIDWKTIENANVIIRITKAKDANTQLAMLDKSVFDAIQTIDQLTEVLAGAKKVEAVSLTTASNKSAGEVFSR